MYNTLVEVYDAIVPQLVDVFPIPLYEEHHKPAGTKWGVVRFVPQTFETATLGPGGYDRVAGSVRVFIFYSIAGFNERDAVELYDQLRGLFPEGIRFGEVLITGTVLTPAVVTGEHRVDQFDLRFETLLRRP